MHKFPISPVLRKLDVSRRRLTVEDIRNLIEHVACSSSLETLDLSYNYLGEDSVAIVGSMFTGSLAAIFKAPLRSLNLTATGLTPRTLEIFAEALVEGRSATLSDICLDENRLPSACAAHLARVIGGAKMFPNLRTLSVASNSLGDEGFSKLLNALTLASSHVRNLDISSNNVGLSGARALERSLKSGLLLLERLNISDNPIGPGIAVIARGLRLTARSNRLVGLTMLGIHITTEAATAMASYIALQPSPPLTQLAMSPTKSTEAEAILMDALQRNCVISDLVLSTGGRPRQETGDRGRESFSVAAASTPARRSASEASDDSVLTLFSVAKDHALAAAIDDEHRTQPQHHRDSKGQPRHAPSMAVPPNRTIRSSDEERSSPRLPESTTSNRGRFAESRQEDDGGDTLRIVPNEEETIRCTARLKKDPRDLQTRADSSSSYPRRRYRADRGRDAQVRSCSPTRENWSGAMKSLEARVQHIIESNTLRLRRKQERLDFKRERDIAEHYASLHRELDRRQKRVDETMETLRPARGTIDEILLTQTSLRRQLKALRMAQEETERRLRYAGRRSARGNRTIGDNATRGGTGLPRSILAEQAFELGLRRDTEAEQAYARRGDGTSRREEARPPLFVRVVESPAFARGGVNEAAPASNRIRNRHGYFDCGSYGI